MSSALDELLQMDASSSPGSKFVKSTTMDKLHVWKADLTKTLEITETEIDYLVHELKSMVSPEEDNGAEDSDVGNDDA